MRVSFDGRGLNDAEDPYKRRLATIPHDFDKAGERGKTGEEMERRINAYDYLKRLLMDRGFTDRRIEGLITKYLREA